MVVYISVTKVKEMITGIMAPVMVSAKKESEFAKKINVKFDEISSKVSDITNQLVVLNRTTKYVEDVQKTMNKFQGDFGNY
jgi:hypothetical protein